MCECELKASDGAGVVFSLASSCPDGKGSSSSSPRCIWQQLLFTAGYCTSFSVFSLESCISKGCERLPHISTPHASFYVNSLTSASNTSFTSRCTLYLLRSVLHCNANQPLRIYRYVRAFVVANNTVQTSQLRRRDNNNMASV